jgi:hypothetical protein
MMMPFLVAYSKLRTETKLIAKRRFCASTRNLVLVWTAVSISCRNNPSCLSLSRTFAFSTLRNGRYRVRHPPTTRLAFVADHKRKTGYNNNSCHYRRTIKTLSIDQDDPWSHRTPSEFPGEGRERRISSSDNQQQKEQQNQYTQEEWTLIQKEESARQKRLDQMEQRFRKVVGLEDRILFLEEKLAREQESAATSLQGSPDATTTTATEIRDDDEDAKRSVCVMTDAERAELNGLLRSRENYEEQYDPQEFSEDHIEFKAIHNDVFARLVRWCEKEREKVTEEDPVTTNVFFLDGPDGGTASSLINNGDLAPAQCYVANRHESTCLSLRQSCGGLLPEENVVHATSSEALTKGAPGAKQQGALAHLEFTGFYFDGCAGYVPHIINMMSSALLVLDDDHDQKQGHPIAVGYSLLGGTKNVVEKELEVSRALTLIARSRGMNIVHALDDPSRFGLPPDVPKLGGKFGNTFTTWLVLQPEVKI